MPANQTAAVGDVHISSVCSNTAAEAVNLKSTVTKSEPSKRVLPSLTFVHLSHCRIIVRPLLANTDHLTTSIGKSSTIHFVLIILQFSFAVNVSSTNDSAECRLGL